jgi:hypothetical protein
MIDKDLIHKHYDMVLCHYPNLNLEQLGLVMLVLCSLRASMGHEGVRGTIDNYIHKDDLSPAVRECIDFLEREILAIKKSKIDIDFWKRGKEGNFRPDRSRRVMPKVLY